eukprot:2830056-Lingulodinium_polyedra.AAC.1
MDPALKDVGEGCAQEDDEIGPGRTLACQERFEEDLSSCHLGLGQPKHQSNKQSYNTSSLT